MERSKKECILEMAGKAFSQFGFKKASIDEIARAAGVAKGTVYLACESKEDLFYQAVHRDLRIWISEVSKMIDPRIPADQLLAQVAQGSLAYLESRPLVRDLFAGLYHGLLPDWRQQFEELRALGHSNVAEILRIGQRQNVFRQDLDVEELAQILQDLQLTGYVLGKRAPAPDLPRRLRAALGLVLNGLRTRDGQTGTRPPL